MKTIQLLKSPKLKPLGLLIYLQLSACLKVDIFSMHFSDLRLILSLSDQGEKKSPSIALVLCSLFVLSLYGCSTVGCGLWQKHPGLLPSKLLIIRSGKLVQQWDAMGWQARVKLGFSASSHLLFIPLPQTAGVCVCLNFSLPHFFFFSSWFCAEGVAVTLGWKWMYWMLRSWIGKSEMKYWYYGSGHNIWVCFLVVSSSLF